mmetsp:Transcript_52407/g.136484  ORF Transcript_52407/g.136484 Transcript_52407/m.136484 type:complete len:480 (+) Transcript_52407:67-1506(+)
MAALAASCEGGIPSGALRPSMPSLLLPGKDTTPSSTDDSTSTSRDGWTSTDCASPRSEANSGPSPGWKSPEWTPRGPESLPEPCAATVDAGGYCPYSPQHESPWGSASYWVPVDAVQHGLIYQCVPVGTFWSADVGGLAAQAPGPVAPGPLCADAAAATPQLQGCWLQAPPMTPGHFPVAMVHGPAPPAPPEPARPAPPAQTPPTQAAPHREATAAGPPVDVIELTELEEQLVQRLSQLPAEELGQAAASLQGHVWRLAAAPRGTQLLQQALLAAGAEDRGRLVAELKGHVNDSWESTAAAPQANYVLQKCIEALPLKDCHFICDEMLVGGVTKAAHSKFGCRIFQRLIEHFPEEDVAPLLEALLSEGDLQALMISRFGNFVVQCILEHGPSEHRSRIAAVLVGEEDKSFAKLAENKYASHVVQHAMKHCSVTDRRRLVSKVLEVEAKDSKFKRSVYGSFVASEARRWARAGAQTRDAR